MYSLASKFNIDEHKKTFVHYLEVSILEDGEIEYAIPSHQEKLISLAMKKLNVSRSELNKMCPPEYYFDFITWLSMMSGAIAVWEHMTMGVVNKAQAATLLRLKEAGLYTGQIPTFS